MRLFLQFGDADALLLAEAEVVHGAARMRAHVDGIERRGHARAHRRLVKAEVQRAEGHVFLDLGREQLAVRVLEHESDVAPECGQARTAVVDRATLPQHPARRRAQQPVQVLQHGGLAGAVGSQQRMAASAPEHEAAAAQAGAAVGEHVVDGLQFEQRRSGHRRSPIAAASSAAPARSAAM
jgi:hypothetical protein